MGAMQMVMLASGGSGLTGGLDTQTIVNGQVGTVPLTNRQTGWSSTIPIGSIGSGSSRIYGGAAITNMYWDEATTSYILTITGTLGNSGWTSIIINRPTPITLLRASASFSTSGGFSSWTWPGAAPVGPPGATYAVGFN